MSRTRRRFLRTAGFAAVGGLAGCTAGVPFLDGDRRIVVDGDPATVADAQLSGGLARRNLFLDRSIPDSVTVDWQLPAVNTGDHTAAKASPLRAPTGDIVIAGDAGAVRAVSPEGEVRWVAETDASARGIHGTPAIANGAVYVGAYDGALYAFDLETGDRYWRSNLGDAIGSSPGYYDGTVYIAVEYHTPSGAMFAVDALTGQVEWRDPRPTNHPHSTCAIDLEAGRLLVGDNDGFLYAWSYPDLEYRWRFPTGEPIKGPVATADGAAFFGSWDDHVYRVSLEDGEEEWAFETGGYVMSGPAVDPERGTVFIGSHDGNLYALDTATGDERWRFETGGYIIGCPTVTADHVLFGSYDWFLYAVEKDTAEETWRVRAGGRVTATPLVTDEAIYVANRASPSYIDTGEGPTGDLYRIRSDE